MFPEAPASAGGGFNAGHTFLLGAEPLGTGNSNVSGFQREVDLRIGLLALA